LAGRLWLTKEGRTVLAALLAKARQWRALPRRVMLLRSLGDHERADMSVGSTIFGPCPLVTRPSIDLSVDADATGDTAMQ
jgi:hypothetical protein